jgi:hypothetical protein
VAGERVNAQILSVSGAQKASAWFDQNKPVVQMTWAPGMPMLIRDLSVPKTKFDNNGGEGRRRPDANRRWIKIGGNVSRFARCRKPDINRKSRKDLFDCLAADANSDRTALAGGPGANARCSP